MEWMITKKKQTKCQDKVQCGIRSNGIWGQVRQQKQSVI